MKHMKTFESFINKSQINEETDLKAIDWSPLFKEINKRLGTRLNLKMDLSGKRPKIISPNFVQETGIFKNILEKISVDIFNYSEKDGNLWMTIDVNYTRRNGGSNGMTFLTAWFEDGKWIFEN